MSSDDTATNAEHISAFCFDETVDRLAEAIAKAGMTIFAKIDHAANAASAGLKMPSATVLIYGSAKGGTPIMIAHPWAALDLPLRVLIREADDGKTAIGFHPVKALLGQAGVPANMAGRLEPAQALLAAAVTP
jgi:uncharacterized protein (DUF302 family)